MPAVSYDLKVSLDDINKRLYRLEQTSGWGAAGDAGSGNEFPDGIIVGPEADYEIIDTSPPGAPTGLTVSEGAFYDRIYFDISWVAPVVDADNAEAVSYLVEIAKKNPNGTYQTPGVFETTFNTSIRAEPFEPLQVYGVRVRAQSNIGRPGPLTAWVDTDPIKDQTVPQAVRNVTAFRAPSSVIVAWDEPVAPDQDVTLGAGVYDVQLSTVSNFATVVDTIRTSALIVSFDALNTVQDYYVRVKAIDASGNEGPWTATTSPLSAGGVTGGEILPDAIVSTHIAANQIYSTHIVAGEIKTGNLAADAVTAGKIAAGEITATHLTTTVSLTVGKTIQSATYTPGSAGWAIFGNGDSEFSNVIVRGTVYATGGTIGGFTIYNNRMDGGTITGGYVSTKTWFGGGGGATNNHIEMSSDNFNGADRLRFYSGKGAAETGVASIRLGGASDNTTVRYALVLSGPGYSDGTENKIVLIAGAGGAAGGGVFVAGRLYSDNSPLEWNGKATFAGVDTNFTGPAYFNNGLTMSQGTATFTGPVNLSGANPLSVGGNLSVSGTMTLNGSSSFQANRPIIIASGQYLQTNTIYSTSGTSVTFMHNLVMNASTNISGVGTLSTINLSVSGTATLSGVNASGATWNGAISTSWGASFGGNVSVPSISCSGTITTTGLSAQGGRITTNQESGTNHGSICLGNGVSWLKGLSTSHNLQSRTGPGSGSYASFTGNIVDTSSAAVFKSDIRRVQSEEKQLPKLRKMKTYKFKFKHDHYNTAGGGKQEYTGFLLDELPAEIIDSYDEAGNPEAYRVALLNGLLISSINELADQVEQLQQQVAELQAA